MRQYTAPGTYNCTWQVMNIASLDGGLERERESFVLFTSLLVVKCGTWTEVQVLYALEKGMSAVQHSDTREEIDL